MQKRGERRGVREGEAGRETEDIFVVSDSGSEKPNNLSTFNRRETEKWSYISYLPLFYFVCFCCSSLSRFSIPDII